MTNRRGEDGMEFLLHNECTDCTNLVGSMVPSVNDTEIKGERAANE